jgi:RNA polymerase sigma-70 factor (ECF subfamily)
MTAGARAIDDIGKRLADDLDAAFEELVRAFQDRVFGFAFRLSANRRDAEEIAQDAFVRAYRALAGYPRERIETLHVAPWLYRIVLNVWRNRVRKNEPVLVSLNGHPERGADDPAMARAESSADLARLLTAVSERARAVLVLRFVEGLTTEETAEAVGRPPGTVKSDVHRGLAQLRAALAERGPREER